MSAIWHQTPDPDYINQHMATGTIAERLGILMTEVGDDFITGTMPADARTFQPYGVVHGGANVVLAETLGSTAGGYVIDQSRFMCLGQDVSATHLRPVSSGLVTGTARPVHLGKRSHVWQMELFDDAGRLSCISKLILAIIERK
tara:strand:- start:87 stop:518 length:432 start_codon:yes stop_codon:yes gene_type:complete